MGGFGGRRGGNGAGIGAWREGGRENFRCCCGEFGGGGEEVVLCEISGFFFVLFLFCLFVCLGLIPSHKFHSSQLTHTHTHTHTHTTQQTGKKLSQNMLDVRRTNPSTLPKQQTSTQKISLKIPPLYSFQSLCPPRFFFPSSSSFFSSLPY